MYGLNKKAHSTLLKSLAEVLWSTQAVFLSKQVLQ